jgi:hypothetical protein
VKAVDILKVISGQLMILIFLQPQKNVYEKGQKAYKGERELQDWVYVVDINLRKGKIIT